MKTSIPSGPEEIQRFVTQLLDKNRARFGDARMEDEGEPTGTETESGDETGENEPAGTEGTEGGEGEGEEADPEEELPESWRDRVTKLRTEAARYRTSLREAEAKLASAKTPEDIAAAVAEFQTRNAELEREVLVSKVARKHELPDDLAAVLQGADEAALEAHAKVLAKYAGLGEGPDSLGGGLDPSDRDNGETDPRKLAQEAGGRRRF